jgi:hypothetical protein
VGDAKGKGKGYKGAAGARSTTPRGGKGGLHYATSTGLSGQKGGGGKERKGQWEHGPAGAAAPLDGSWQEQRAGRSGSRNRGFENLDAKVQESVNLLVQSLQHDTQAKGKGMAGLTTRKGKGKGAQVAKETVFDQTAIGICEGRIRCLRSMLEAATSLRDQGGFATPADELQKWTNGLELLVQELGILKKGVDRDLPGDEEDMEDEPEIDPEGYLAGQRRWKLDPNVSLGDKIQVPHEGGQAVQSTGQAAVGGGETCFGH